MSFEEQITSKDKYASIVSPQMEATVFIILQIFHFCNTRSFQNWGISLGCCPVLAREYSVT